MAVWIKCSLWPMEFNYDESSKEVLEYRTNNPYIKHWLHKMPDSGTDVEIIESKINGVCNNLFDICIEGFIDEIEYLKISGRYRLGQNMHPNAPIIQTLLDTLKIPRNHPTIVRARFTWLLQQRCGRMWYNQHLIIKIQRRFRKRKWRKNLEMYMRVGRKMPREVYRMVLSYLR
jgi:hypothetical protein